MIVSRRRIVMASAFTLVGCTILTDWDGLHSDEQPIAGDGGDETSDARVDSNTPADASFGDRRTADITFDAGPGGATYSATVRADGPIAYYPLEEATGTTATDLIGGQNGHYVGGATVGVAGAVGRGAGFDGTSARLEMPMGAFSFLDRSPFTIEVWVRADVVNEDVRRVFASGSVSDAPNTGGYGLEFHQHTLWTYREDGSSSDSYATQAPPVVGTFHHVVMAYDGDRMTLYKDGTPSGSPMGALSLVSAPDARLVFGDLPQPRFVKLRGVIDEIAIYDKALSGTVVTAHYQAR